MGIYAPGDPASAYAARAGANPAETRESSPDLGIMEEDADGQELADQRDLRGSPVWAFSRRASDDFGPRAASPVGEAPLGGTSGMLELFQVLQAQITEVRNLALPALLAAQHREREELGLMRQVDAVREEVVRQLQDFAEGRGAVPEREITLASAVEKAKAEREGILELSIVRRGAVAVLRAALTEAYDAAREITAKAEELQRKSDRVHAKAFARQAANEVRASVNEVERAVRELFLTIGARMPDNAGEISATTSQAAHVLRSTTALLDRNRSERREAALRNDGNVERIEHAVDNCQKSLSHGERLCAEASTRAKDAFESDATTVMETLKSMEATVRDTLQLALGSNAIHEAEDALALAVKNEESKYEEGSFDELQAIADELEQANRSLREQSVARGLMRNLKDLEKAGNVASVDLKGGYAVLKPFPKAAPKKGARGPAPGGGKQAELVAEMARDTNVLLGLFPSVPVTLEVAIGGGKEAEGVAKTRAGKLVTALEEENYPESQVTVEIKPADPKTGLLPEQIRLKLNLYPEEVEAEPASPKAAGAEPKAAAKAKAKSRSASPGTKR